MKKLATRGDSNRKAVQILAVIMFAVVSMAIGTICAGGLAVASRIAELAAPDSTGRFLLSSWLFGAAVSA